LGTWGIREVFAFGVTETNNKALRRRENSA
jgi:hypothetical protein